MNPMSLPLALIAALLLADGVVALITAHGQHGSLSDQSARQLVSGEVIVSRIRTVQVADQTYQKANKYALAPSVPALSGMPPAFLSSMSIGSGAGPSGLSRWACFSATVYPDQGEAFKTAQKKLGASSFVSDVCGVSVDTPPVHAPGGPFKLALTYWYQPLVAPAGAPSAGGSAPPVPLDMTGITNLSMSGSSIVASGVGTMPTWCASGTQETACHGHSHHSGGNNCWNSSFTCVLPAGSTCTVTNGVASCVAP